jgi:hypothetical protein
MMPKDAVVNKYDQFYAKCPALDEVLCSQLFQVTSLLSDGGKFVVGCGPGENCLFPYGRVIDDSRAVKFTGRVDTQRTIHLSMGYHDATLLVTDNCNGSQQRKRNTIIAPDNILPSFFFKL